MSKLTTCITVHGAKHKGTLPKIVVDAAKNNNKEAAQIALQGHIEKLTDSLKDIQEQHQKNVESFKTEIISGTAAFNLTNQPEDPTNELNTFEPKSFDKVRKNLVQRAGSIQALLLKVLGKNTLTQDQQELLKFYSEGFNRELGKEIIDILNIKENNSFPFRYEDMIQYLVQRQGDKHNPWLKPLDPKGKLHPAVRAAITATSFEWLATNGRMAMGQTESSLEQLLNLSKGDKLPDDAFDVLGDLGMDAETLAKRLGRVILERLSIGPTDQSDSAAKARMELSLGFMAVAAMEKAGYLHRQNLIMDFSKEKKAALQKAGKYDKAGLEAYKDGDSEPLILFKDTTSEEGMKGYTTRKLVVLDTKTITVGESKKTLPNDKILKIEELFKKNEETKATFDNIFANEPQIFGIRRKAPKAGNMTIGDSSIPANAQHKANLEKYMSIPYQRNEHAWGLMKAIYDMAQGEENADIEKAFWSILGMPDTTHQLNVKAKNAAGIERGLRRDWENALAYDEEIAKGAPNQFFIGSSFMGNTRMLQEGPINPQNSKVHRNLFSPSAWTVSFNPKRNKKMTERFKQAIAVAFDIESGKVGGVENQLKKLDQLFDQTQEGKPGENARILNQALMILRMTEPKNLTKSDILVLSRATQILGNKLHGLKGLIEYARFQAHDKGDFTTDIYNEIDGVSNGPIIGMLQFIPDTADKSMIMAALAMGGLSTSSRFNLDEKLNENLLNDSYQRMGQEWAKQVALLLKEFAEGKDPDPKKFNQGMAIKALLGDLVYHVEADGKNEEKEGIVNKTIRNLSKPRTMQTVYGAGDFKQIQLLTKGDIVYGSIYKKMEEIIEQIAKLQPGESQAVVEQSLKDLLANVAELVNYDRSAPPYLGVNYYKTNGALDIEKLKDFRLKPQDISNINKAVSQTYGEAMKKAIDYVYGDLIKARQPFVLAAQAAVLNYNMILRKKVDQKIAEHKTDVTNKFPERLTVAELKEILASIEHLVPKIKTPLHTKENPSYLPLAYPDKRHAFSDNPEVLQNYASGKGISRLKGYVSHIPYLANPGMAPIVTAIQMIDAMTANGLMGKDTHFLNNHDGFSHAITDSEQLMLDVNTVFKDIMTNYSLGEVYQEMHEQLQADSQTIMNELGITQEDQFKGLQLDSTSNERTGGIFKEEKFITAALLKEMGLIDSVENFDTEVASLANESELSFAEARQRRMYRIIRMYGEEKFTKELFEHISKSVESMAEQTARNKKAITDAIAQWGQYPFNGTGVVVSPENKTGNIDFKDRHGNTTTRIKTAGIIPTEMKNNENTQREMQDLIKEGYASSQNASVSTKASDYPNSQKIDSMNVNQVFDSLVAMDDQKGFGAVQASKEHLAHLKHLLDSIIKGVMSPAEMYLGTRTTDGTTEGLFQEVEGGNNRIWIQTQQASGTPYPGLLGHGIRMSTGEVFVHELIHHVTNTALNGSSDLKKQAQALYDLAYNRFTAMHGENAFRVFMNDPSVDIMDPAPEIQNEVMAAKARWNYVFDPAITRRDDGSNAGLKEFITHGLTNENFKRELGKLSIPEQMRRDRQRMSDIFSWNLQTTLANLFQRMMTFIQMRFQGLQHSTKVDQELENLVRAMAVTESKGKSLVYAKLENLEQRATALSIKIDDRIKESAVKKLSATALGKLYMTVKSFPELDNMISHQLRVALLWYNDQERGLIPSIISEMQGNTLRLEPLQDLLQRRHVLIDMAKVEAAENISQAANSYFQSKLSQKAKVAITKGLLKTDIGALLPFSTKNAIQGFISDGKQREDQIRTLVGQLQADPDLKEFATFYENAANDLGYFMVTNKAQGRFQVPFMNAHNIVLMQDTKYRGRIKVGSPAYQKAVGIVDQLATLSSLRYVAGQHVHELKKLMDEDWSGVEAVLTVHNNMKAKAMQDLFHGNPALMLKGYIKQIVDGRIKFDFGTLQDEQAFADAGYVLMSMPLPRDSHDPVQEDIYIYKSHLGMVNDLQPGIASYTQNRAKGRNAYDIQGQIGNTANPQKIAESNDAIMKAEVLSRIDNMFKTRPSNYWINRDDATYMVPKFDSKGQIAQMRYEMTEHTKDTILNQHSDFDAVLAAMEQQRIDKQFTPVVNQELILALKEMYDKEGQKYAEAYVEISPYSKNQRYRDIYQQLPPRVRDQIRSVWGDDRIYVAQDVVDLAFGQRQYTIMESINKSKEDRGIFENLMVEGLTGILSISNPWSKRIKENANIDYRKFRVLTRARAIEDLAIQFAKYGKTNIVVRNLPVLSGNHQSNLMYLKSKGMPLGKILEYQREAFLGVIEYQKLKDELFEYRHKREIEEARISTSAADKKVILKNLDRAIARVENELAGSKVRPLIEAGIMPTLVDDTETAHVQSPYLYGAEKWITDYSKKLPPKLQRLGKVMFMTEETQGFKLLNNAVRMTDFIGRYALYHHYVISEKMDPKTAERKVMDEFINFELPTHRLIDYGNRVGLIMFSKYQLRVLKHIKNLLMERPFTALATFLIGSYIGDNNILNSIPGVTKDASMILGNPWTMPIRSLGDIVTVDGVQVMTGM